MVVAVDDGDKVVLEDAVSVDTGAATAGVLELVEVVICVGAAVAALAPDAEIIAWICDFVRQTGELSLAPSVTQSLSVVVLPVTVELALSVPTAASSPTK